MQEKSYTESEIELISQIKERIQNEEHREVNEVLTSMEENIRHLTQAFLGYPSILSLRESGDDHQSVQTLIETLFGGGIDHTVFLPTKVTVGRSFMIAKFNLFGYLRKLSDRVEAIKPFQDELQLHWESVIFSLLLEDVYQVIIERGEYDTDIRRQAAMDLIHFWEHRFDHNVTEYAPILVKLWSVRRRIVPVFGTMLGTIELMRLSGVLPRRWYDFLDSHAEEEDLQHALEEFIFGLAYEDLCRVREDMQKRKISVIDREELGRMQGIDLSADDVSKIDPREMYRFYQERTKRANSRKDYDLPGPRRTVEELLLVHMIAQK